MFVALYVWLDIEMGYGAAWLVMIWFAVKDLIFTIFGAMIAPRIYHAIKRPHRPLNRKVKNHV